MSTSISLDSNNKIFSSDVLKVRYDVPMALANLRYLANFSSQFCFGFQLFSAFSSANL